MQTFLPYDNFNLSLEVLDYRRLGKQRVESFQLLNALLGRTESKGWINHPIAKMWKGYENALKLYLNKSIEIWKSQGYNNTMKYEDIKGEIIYPDWKDNPNNPYVWYDTQKKQFYKHIVKTGQKNYIK